MNLDVRIKLTPSIEELTDALGGDVREALPFAMGHLMADLEANAVEEAPVDEGDLVNSITHYLTDGGLVGVLKATAPHAIFVHEGTKAHYIFPKNKKALFWPGAGHPVAWVWHPGTRPNKFFKRAIKKTDIGGSFEEGLSVGLKRRGW